MALQTIGTYDAGQNTFQKIAPAHGHRQCIAVQGWTVSSGNSADKTLSAFGGVSGTAFYLTYLAVSLHNATYTCNYNVLYNGDTIASLGGTGLHEFKFKSDKYAGLLSDSHTSTGQLLTLTMTNTAANNTGTVAGIIAKGITLVS